MPTKRLVLAQPFSDGVNQFPFVDVRLWNAINDIAVNKNVDSDCFFIFEWQMTFAINFYRLVSGQRIFLSDNYTPRQRLLKTPRKIKAPVNTADFNAVVDVFINGNAASKSQFGFNPNMIRYSMGPENPFEAIGAATAFPMYPGIRVLLIQEGCPDFTGLTIVEDAA